MAAPACATMRFRFPATTPWHSLLTTTSRPGRLSPTARTRPSPSPQLRRRPRPPTGTARRHSRTRPPTGTGAHRQAPITHDDDGSTSLPAANGNGGASARAAPHDDGNGFSSLPAANTNGSNGAAPAAAKLWIRIEESSDPVQDEYLLRGVVKLLMNYPGDGPVALRIRSDGRTVIGELPFVSVSYCAELHDELEAMVGAGGVELDGGDGGTA